MGDIKTYNCTIDFTEYTRVTCDVVVYARSQEDADFIARKQFLDRRRDKPIIDKVLIKEIKP